MASEQQMEVFKQHRAAQDKYVYFLLAAAGAAIAFAVTQTQTATLNWPKAPLGAAVLLWGLSFYFGCRNVTYSTLALGLNAELLKVQQGEDHRIGNDPQAIAQGSVIVREVLDDRATIAGSSAYWQFICLVLGAVCYVAWHVYEMWLRTPT